MVFWNKEPAQWGSVTSSTLVFAQSTVVIVDFHVLCSRWLNYLFALLVKVLRCLRWLLQHLIHELMSGLAATWDGGLWVGWQEGHGLDLATYGAVMRGCPTFVAKWHALAQTYAYEKYEYRSFLSNMYDFFVRWLFGSSTKTWTRVKSTQVGKCAW